MYSNLRIIAAFAQLGYLLTSGRSPTGQKHKHLITPTLLRYGQILVQSHLKLTSGSLVCTMYLFLVMSTCIFSLNTPTRPDVFTVLDD